MKAAVVLLFGLFSIAAAATGWCGDSMLAHGRTGLLLPEEPVETVTPPAIAREAPDVGGEVRHIAGLRGKQSRVEIYYGGRLVRTIEAESGEFQEELPLSTSSSGNIALLHRLESGTLHVSPGEVQRYDRYYCNFVDLRNGCILERRAGEFCGGEWAEGDTWRDLDGRKNNLLAKRLTAEQVARPNEPPADDAVWSYPNLQHCDPPGPHNRSSYVTLLKANAFSLSPAQLRAAREDVEGEW